MTDERVVPEPGMYTGIRSSEYHGTWAACNQSTLKKLDGRKPPAKAKYEIEHPTPASLAMEKGTALHARVLQPELFDELVMLGPTATRRSNKWKDMKKARPDLCLLEAPEMEAVRMMTDSLLHDEDFAMIVEAAKHADAATEVAVCSDLPTVDKDGKPVMVRAKGLLDWWLPELGYYVDLKTTKDASEDEFRRSVEMFGYHIQGAYYSRLLAEQGYEVKSVILALVENTPPYLSVVREIDPASLDRGEQKIDKLLPIYHECVTSGIWPGYPKGITYTGVPDWALRQAV
jgi:hypothetical protein